MSGSMCFDSIDAPQNKRKEIQIQVGITKVSRIKVVKVSFLSPSMARFFVAKISWYKPARLVSVQYYNSNPRHNLAAVVSGSSGYVCLVDSIPLFDPPINIIISYRETVPHSVGREGAPIVGTHFAFINNIYIQAAYCKKSVRVNQLYYYYRGVWSWGRDCTWALYKKWIPPTADFGGRNNTIPVYNLIRKLVIITVIFRFIWVQ